MIAIKTLELLNNNQIEDAKKALQLYILSKEHKKNGNTQLFNARKKLAKQSAKVYNIGIRGAYILNNKQVISNGYWLVAFNDIMQGLEEIDKDMPKENYFNYTNIFNNTQGDAIDIKIKDLKNAIALHKTTVDKKDTPTVKIGRTFYNAIYLLDILNALDNYKIESLNNARKIQIYADNGKALILPLRQVDECPNGYKQIMQIDI